MGGRHVIVGNVLFRNGKGIVAEQQPRLLERNRTDDIAARLDRRTLTLSVREK